MKLDIIISEWLQLTLYPFWFLLNSTPLIRFNKLSEQTGK